jgi:hypothetical protein
MRMTRILGGFLLPALSVLLVGMIAPASASAGIGPPPGGVQHQLTNGTFATAEWVSQTPQTATDTAITAIRHPGLGGTELTVTQIVTTYDAAGNPIDTTQTTVDALSGFIFTIDGTLFRQAAVAGLNLPAQTCDELTGACSATTLDVSAQWSGQGAITRGAITSKDIEVRSNFLFIQIEHMAGATRAAAATGTIGAQTYSATDAISPPTLGTIRTGFIFLCLDGGCEN